MLLLLANLDISQYLDSAVNTTCVNRGRSGDDDDDGGGDVVDEEGGAGEHAILIS